MIRKILADAATIDALQAAIHSTWKRRGEGPDAMAAWELACDAFHTRYDSLAWPGGLMAGFAELKAGAPAAIETAIAYLEADPVYFRSGYLKVEVIRAIRRHPLTQQQVERLGNVILARIRGEDRREFRAFCRLATRIASPALLGSVQDLSRDNDPRVARHAAWVLKSLVAT